MCLVDDFILLITCDNTENLYLWLWYIWLQTKQLEHDELHLSFEWDLYNTAPGILAM